MSHPAAATTARPSAKQFGFWSIVLLTINSIIGTGIFLSPAGVVKIAGVWTPLIYVLAGVFACVLAVVFASAAKYVTKNGASYAYAHAAFGDGIGFYVGITRFVAGAIAWGVMATAVVKTTLGIVAGKAAASDLVLQTVGFLVLMGVLLAINVAGTGVTRWFNDLSTLGKVLALVLVIAAGAIMVVTSGSNHLGDLATAKSSTGAPLIADMNVSVFVGALLAAFYAFTGFETVATAASEMKDPAKNLPRAIPIGIAAVTAIYVGVVTVAMMVNPLGILNSKDPVVLASAFDNPLLRGVIVAGALVSMFGINVAASFSTPRILDALAREGHVPAALAKTNSRGVPVAAFALTALLAVAVPLAFLYDMKGIMVISSVSRFVQFLVVPAALIAFYFNKAKRPILDAPRNAFTDVVIPILGFAASVFLLVQFNWAAQFSLLDAKGNPTGEPNWWAIGAMIIGYLVLPAVLWALARSRATQEAPRA